MLSDASEIIASPNPESVDPVEFARAVAAMISTGLLELDEYELPARGRRNSIVEAVLKADGSGMLFKHPFINNKLQQLLTKWAFKVSTGGGFRMPAFVLADDGYLFSHNGQVFAGSDWIPEDWSISSLPTKRGLVILKLNLLDVVIEVQRDQRLYGSRPEQLSLQDFGRLASPSPHRVGVCVVHSCLDYIRSHEAWRLELLMVRVGFGDRSHI